MKKDIKKSSKMTKKTKKPELILNCTNCVTEADVQEAYIDAKVRAGKAISNEELQFVKDNAAVFVDIINLIEMHYQKEPWYKRFWNWLRRK